MTWSLDILLRSLFAVAAALYFWLAVRVARAGPQPVNSVIGQFLLLIGIFVAGAAFSFRTEQPVLFGIGRVLSLAASGFLPIAAYCLYRQYTSNPPRPVLIVGLSIIPIGTTLLAMTNPMHHLVWATLATEAGVTYSEVTDHFWFTRVHAPFAYGLFAFSIAALASQTTSIALAHRRNILVLLTCAAMPFLVSVGNTLLRIGPIDFPFTSTTLVFLLPLYAYASLRLRLHEFSPLAYKTLFDHVRDPIIVLSSEHRIVCANAAAQKLLGSAEPELIGRYFWREFPEVRSMLEQAKSTNLTQTLRMDDDHVYELSVGPLYGSRGQDLGIVVVCRDVTERRRTLARLAASEHLVRTLIETSSNGVLRFARDEEDAHRRFRCVFANRAADNYLGDAAGALVGMPLTKLDALLPSRLMDHFCDERSAHSPISYETVIETANGHTWLRIVGEPVGDDFSVTLLDITQRKRHEDKMMADALRDPLTGVLNRRGFEKEANTCIRECSMGAVLYLDLNHFKSINDGFGHHAGDALLKAFGHRLEFCLRPEDILGRLGGDEFAILLPGIDVSDAKHVAKRLMATAAEPYIIQGEEINCSASVGIALLPQHGEELWHLISVADDAMYRLKSAAREAEPADHAAYVDAAVAS